jgi:hypothetical protein
MISANEQGAMSDDSFQGWILRNTVSTSRPESSSPVETLGEDNRALDKRPVSDTYAQFAPSVGEVHHEASTSSTVELSDETPDHDTAFEWLVEDSWAFICDYDSETGKRLCKERPAKTATLGTSQKTKSKGPYKFRKRSITLVCGEEVDTSRLPTPVCSCTGTPRKCYAWGRGGWSSACCTATLSMYPLPTYPGRDRNARMIGRTMCLSTYTKVLEIMYVKGHDPSNPIDLKDHWTKLGSNQFSVKK